MPSFKIEERKVLLPLTIPVHSYKTRKVILGSVDSGKRM
jgi:hypothetical protein